MEAIKEMEMGQLVDYIIEYNKMHDYGTDTKAPKNKVNKRKATQADWDALCG